MKKLMTIALALFLLVTSVSAFAIDQHEPEFYEDIVSEVWDCSKWTTKLI